MDILGARDLSVNLAVDTADWTGVLSEVETWIQSGIDLEEKQ
jgi:hypothetical protein